MTFEESVRKRPFMFIGNDGVVGLLTGLIINCIEFCKTDQIIFEIKISGDNDFVFAISTQQNLDQYWQRFLLDDTGSGVNFFLKVLKVISSAFEIKNVDKTKSQISFSIDKEVINTDIDYLKLSEKIIQLALLNRRCEIITIDTREKYAIQNYYCFSQGVFYIFDRAITEVLGKPEFKLKIDRKINDNSYQVGLAYRTDWFPTPHVVSFANDIRTICNGSLVDGVLDGLLSACKSYVKGNKQSLFKINRKKLINGLIVVCAVRGQEFTYGGSWKETLEDEAIKKEAKGLVVKSVSEFFETQREITDKFFSRFDTRELSSGMY